MTYKEATEHWISDLFSKVGNNLVSVDDAQHEVVERVLQSFKNGLRAKPRGEKPLVSQPSPEQA